MDMQQNASNFARLDRLIILLIIDLNIINSKKKSYSIYQYISDKIKSSSVYHSEKKIIFFL